MSMLALFRLVLTLVTSVWVTSHTAIGAIFRPESQRLDYRLRRQVIGCRAVCRAVNIHVKIADNTVPLESGALVVCNHFSAMDPLILGSLLKLCFVGKAAIERWPVLGWVCRTHGMLVVNRKHRLSAVTLSEQVESRLRKGISVLLFSEGTTSDGVDLWPFKSGGFASVAGMEGGRVQPVYLEVAAINGSRLATPQDRAQLSHNRHPTLIRHLINLFGHRRIDFCIGVGPTLATAQSDRKSLARAAHEQVKQLAINMARADKQQYHGDQQSG